VPEHRYGALHMFADFLDNATLPDLRAAAAREEIEPLRSDMERLIQLIEAQ